MEKRVARRGRLPLERLLAHGSSSCRNPIEQLFAKLKHFMRRAAKRSAEAVHNAIAATLTAMTPKECF